MYTECILKFATMRLPPLERNPEINPAKYIFIGIIATATINFSLTWVQLLIEGCSYSRAAFINPWHACVRVTVVILCVYHHASCYIPRLYVENTVPLSFLHCFLLVYCVYFTEKALFGSSGDIC